MRILIVDDHETFRKGIRTLLESTPEIMVCGEAASGLESVEKARSLQPDVILMDISMYGMNGLDATQLIRSQVPTSRIIILSQHDSPHMLSAAIKVGASAYVTKSQVARCLLRSIDAVMKGQPFGWHPEKTSEELDGLNGSPESRSGK